MPVSYFYGRNFEPEQLGKLNEQHQAMLKEIGADVPDDFWISGMPKIRLVDQTPGAQGKPICLDRFAGRLKFGPGTGILSTGDNPYRCDCTRISLIRWGEQAEECGLIECYSELNHTTLTSACKITIGRNVLFGANVTVMDTDGHAVDRRLPDVPENRVHRPVVIEDHAWLGWGATVIKGVTVGHHAVVAAQAVVVRDVPPHTVVAGNPARVVKTFD